MLILGRESCCHREIVYVQAREYYVRIEIQSGTSKIE